MKNLITAPRAALVGAASLTALSLAFSAPAEAIVTIIGQEVGSNVVFSYSGSINLTGLGSSVENDFGTTAILPNVSTLFFLPAPDSSVDFYGTPISGPTSFGTGGFSATPSTESNNLFSFDAGSNFIAFAPGYAGGSIAGAVTFTNTNLTTLGVTSNQLFTWTLTNNDTITLQATPVPLETDALPVVVSAAFMAGGIWWKKKRAGAKVADFAVNK